MCTRERVGRIEREEVRLRTAACVGADRGAVIAHVPLLAIAHVHTCKACGLRELYARSNVQRMRVHTRVHMDACDRAVQADAETTTLAS